MLAKVTGSVMASVTEAELGALLMSAQEAVAICNRLESTGCKQPPTPIETNNAAASGIINDTMKQLRSKAMDV